VTLTFERDKEIVRLN